MELSKEVIESAKLSEEQVSAVKAYGESYVANIKKEYDTTANTNAEGILEGVVKSIQKKTGIEEPRQQGEKYAAYLERVSSKVLETKQSELAKAKEDYEAKMKDFKGGDALKSEVEAAKKAYDDLQKQTADYADIKKKAEQFDEVSTKYSSLKVGTAFRDVKPPFPDTVNPYEAAAKWGEFEKGVLNDYDVEIVDGKPMAISKENKHRIVPLESLVKENKDIQALAVGRQASGTGAAAEQGKTSEIEGVPFPITELAKTDTKERAKLIEAQLAKEGIAVHTKEYSLKFQDYNSKIKAAKSK